MTEPLISVMMPLKYYHPELLRKAVASIVRQTCPSWSFLIVVEQTDVEKFQHLLKEPLEDPRIELITNRRRGFPGALNSAVAHARTPFVAILLADDMWASDAVAVLSAYIATYPDVDFFHSSRMVIDEDDVPLSPVFRSKETFAVDDFRWGSQVKHLLCWRKAKGLAAGGIDESLLKAQDDYDFPWTMAEQGASFKAVGECLYLYRNHIQCERLTTHRPLSVTKRGIRMILRKHGVGLLRRTFIVAKMRRLGSLGAQCIYRNQLDRWIQHAIGRDATRGWKQQIYRSVRGGW